MKYSFWGTDDFSLNVLNSIKDRGFALPNFIVTFPDKPKGRKLELTPSPVKVFAIQNKIDFITPEKLNDEVLAEIISKDLDINLVASYGKIIPERFLNSAKAGTLNIHPSLLPLYRGPSPIETAILDDQRETGVSLMLLDQEMDHGPILAQEKITFGDEQKDWPNKDEIYFKLANIGAKLFIDNAENFVNKKTEAVEQNHSLATYTKKFEKPEGEISNFNRKDFLKFIAFNPGVGTFFFVEKNEQKIRVKITEAVFEEGKIQIKKVIPEGKNEMTFSDFENGYLKK